MTCLSYHIGQSQLSFPSQKSTGSLHKRDGRRKKWRKLFVGHLPKSLSLEDLRCFLSEYSPIEDLSLIVDPVTRQPKGMRSPRLLCSGCAFVYVNSDREAELLINSLNDKYRFPDVFLCWTYDRSNRSF